jgi:hypothetical protein
MSGTDDLFPDATPLPGAAVPPPPPGLTEPAAAGSAAASADAPHRRGIGVAAFVLGLLAILGDLIGVTVAFFTLLGAVGNIGATLTNVDNSLGAILGVVILEFLVFFGGIVFAALAVILGIVAAARNRGRVLGVFGVIFGLVVLVTHLVLGISIATSSGNVPGLTS